MFALINYEGKLECYLIVSIYNRIYYNIILVNPETNSFIKQKSQSMLAHFVIGYKQTNINKYKPKNSYKHYPNYPHMYV